MSVGLTAQRMEAASSEGNPSGIGVTWLTNETAYSENVPSTLKPLSLASKQAKGTENKLLDAPHEEASLLTLLTAITAVLAVQATVGEQNQDRQDNEK